MALPGRRSAAEKPGTPRRRVQTEAQFCKCGNADCGATIFIKEVEKNYRCCPQCGHHFRVGSRKRAELTLDPGTWSELFEHLESLDPLKFTGRRRYAERLKESMERTGLKDAVLCGEARIEGHPLVFGAMDFQFMGGSMGSVVGEKVTRAIEHATKKRWPLVLVCCSGGARMDEGVLSLMQMAKTAAAIQRHFEAGLLYVSVLTDPTLAGVSASFAFLADIILAEPRAMIGFTGARVIEQTIRVKLPEGFQEAEFLLEHGQIDRVVPRKKIRATLANILDYWNPGNGRRAEAPGTARPRKAPRKTAVRKTAARPRQRSRKNEKK